MAGNRVVRTYQFDWTDGVVFAWIVAFIIALAFGLNGVHWCAWIAAGIAVATIVVSCSVPWMERKTAEAKVPTIWRHGGFRADVFGPKRFRRKITAEFDRLVSEGGTVEDFQVAFKQFRRDRG